MEAENRGLNNIGTELTLRSVKILAHFTRLVARPPLLLFGGMGKEHHLEKAVRAFSKVGKELGVIK